VNASKADEIAAKAKKLAEQQAAKKTTTAAAGHDDDPRASTHQERSSVHTKPIRSTVDLPPMRHAQLKAWLGETAVMVGKSRVTTQDVFRVFVDRLLTDEEFARKIRSDLGVSD
jgi:hypothetical protein